MLADDLAAKSLAATLANPRADGECEANAARAPDADGADDDDDVDEDADDE